MEYRPLGRTGVRVSEICLGTMMFGGKTDKAESIRIIDHAIDQGVNSSFSSARAREASGRLQREGYGPTRVDSGAGSLLVSTVAPIPLHASDGAARPYGGSLARGGNVMRSLRSHHRALVILLLVAGLAPAGLLAQADTIPRTASGKPDLSGTYDAATLTPLERPREFGDKLYMTRKEAEKIAAEQAELIAKANKTSDPNRDAPESGGAPVVGFEDNPEAGEAFGAGNVGGYNWFWVDPGEEAFSIDGKFRTSILTEPKNGRMPPMTPAAQAEFQKLIAGFRRPNDGTAYWLEDKGPGPYDNMEQRPNAERCLLGFTGTAPTLPSLYNNYKRIVQTDTHVAIVLEMVHDARIVRMNSTHPGPEVQKWLGDSIGWWEGDTLVVETTNFSPKARGFRGGSENMKVVERFSRAPDGNVVYNFKVEDPTVWTAPWGGEYIWKATGERMFEYACHEGNYALGNIMRGARLLEAEAQAKK